MLPVYRPVPVYSPRLLQELRGMSGGRHCFLRQLAEDDGAPLRRWLEEGVALLPRDLALATSDQLRSLDNLRFYQGVAMVTVVRVLRASDWELAGSREERTLEARAPGGELVDVFGLGFVRQVRPRADSEVIARLARALDRVGSRSRVAVVVRRWLPHDFDPEPVRRAIDLWLREVDRGGWEGRYAAYDDDNISLEFALTGERARGSSGVVAFALPPLDGLHAVETLQRRIMAELDSRRATTPRHRPQLVVATCNQPWPAGRGSLREHLLGKPVAMTTGGSRGQELHYGAEQSPSLFRDPFHRDLAGLLLASPSSDDGVPASVRAWLNPWCTSPLPSAAFSVPSLARDREEAGATVMRWFPGGELPRPS